MKTTEIPFPCRTDSYKTTHYLAYPDCSKMVAYGEFRKSYPGVEDERITFFGVRYIVEEVLNHQYTIEEVEAADKFFQTHNAGFTPYPFPKDLFLKFIAENDGYFPIKVEALQEGSVIYPHTPVYQITAEAPYAQLVTYLETLLTHIWYPTTVATLSRHVKTIIQRYFKMTVDEANFWKLDSRLHDFGYRGCTSEEQAVIGGVAHLLNFGGSDTVAAAYYAQYHLNGGKPVASSIPASEHSIMTAYTTEQDAVERMLELFGQNDSVNKLGIFATVGDSYDYKNFLDNIVPNVYEKFKGKFGLWVIRPDSGDPVECVLMGLRAAEKAFGVTVNSKGFKVLNGAAVIQGDGIDIHDVAKILEATAQAGFSVENVAFGMGGGLLQKMNRDTLSFATKLSHITYNTGETLDVMKRPKTDSNKFSLPGEMKVIPNDKGIYMVYPKEASVPGADGDVVWTGNVLDTVYDKGPVNVQWFTFDNIRTVINTQYAYLPTKADPISPEMKAKIAGLVKAEAK